MAILEMGPALLMATQEAGLEITAWKCPADETGDTECTWDACNGGNTCGGDNVIVPTPILKKVVQTWASPLSGPRACCLSSTKANASKPVSESGGTYLGSTVVRVFK